MKAIISYIEALFSSLPKTPEVLRMQAEITENAEDRYHDLIAEGKGEAEATGIVIGGIGTLEELKAELDLQDASPQADGLNAENAALLEEYYAFRKKFATAIAGAVGLFILSVVAAAFVDQYTHNDAFTGAAMFIPVAVGVAICIIFGLQMEGYEKRLGIEEKESGESYKWSGLFASVGFPMATAVFLLLGFLKDAWHPAWVVFPIMGILTGVVGAIEEFVKKNH